MTLYYLIWSISYYSRKNKLNIFRSVLDPLFTTHKLTNPISPSQGTLGTQTRLLRITSLEWKTKWVLLFLLACLKWDVSKTLSLMERSSHVLVQQSGRYHGSGCHNAAKIAQRWSASRAGLQRWVGLQPAQLCDGLPAQTQSSEPVTACDSCVTAAWQLAGVTDTNSFSGRQSLRRVRPGQVAWPRGLHRMVMVTSDGDQGSVSEQDFKCEIQTSRK